MANQMDRAHRYARDAIWMNLKMARSAATQEFNGIDNYFVYAMALMGGIPFLTHAC